MYTNAHGKPDTNNENIPITLNFLFFSSDAVHGAGQIMCFLLCVCVSVTFVHSVNTNKDIFTFFYTIGPTPFQFFCTKRHGNIPTGTALTGASNAGGVDRNRVSAAGAIHLAATGEFVNSTNTSSAVFYYQLLWLQIYHCMQLSLNVAMLSLV